MQSNSTPPIAGTYNANVDKAAEFRGGEAAKMRFLISNPPVAIAFEKYESMLRPQSYHPDFLAFWASELLLYMLDNAQHDVMLIEKLIGLYKSLTQLFDDNPSHYINLGAVYGYLHNTAPSGTKYIQLAIKNYKIAEITQLTHLLLAGNFARIYWKLYE